MIREYRDDAGIVNEFALMYHLRNSFPLHYIAFKQTASHIPHEGNSEQLFSRSGALSDDNGKMDPARLAVWTSIGVNYFGLYILFRQTKRKTEGPQHFAFPEISRENRGCLVLHSGNSRVSLSLRAGLGQNLRQNRGNRQHPGLFPGIPGFFQVYAQNTRYFADLADFGPKTSLRLGGQSPKFDDFHGVFPGK